MDYRKGTRKRTGWSQRAQTRQQRTLWAAGTLGNGIAESTHHSSNVEPLSVTDPAPPHMHCTLHTLGADP